MAKIAMLATAATLFAGLAQAQSSATAIPFDSAPAAAAPVAAAPFADGDWTGFYLGLQTGSGSFTLDGYGSVSGNGFGLHFGYLRDFGQFVLGAELASTAIWTEESDGSDGVGHFKLRAGFDADRSLPYLAVGSASYIDTYYGESDIGVMFAAGVDHKLTDKFTLGVEFSRSTFVDFLGFAGETATVDMFVLRGAYHF